MTRHATIFVLLILAGCQAPLARLSFPYRPVRASNEPQRFDVNGDGRDDFSITFDTAGRVDGLCYDDDEDGHDDRVYHIGDYAHDEVPHLIILLDSVPFRCVAEHYAAGELHWFGPPAKVIAPFPSMTEVCYTQLLGAPPMTGVIDQHYDRRTHEVNSGLWSRVFGGYQYPWERRLHYRSAFREEGLAYLNPRPWYHAELERAKRAFDASADHVTLVYLTSASGMACKYGRAGIDEVINGAAQLCLQLLYERRGAIRISLMADHGHNLVEHSKNIDVASILRHAGFRVASSLRQPDDVVPEISGLVTYAAVRTMQPVNVAMQLRKHEGVEFVMYLEQDKVIVWGERGWAAIDARGDRIRYTPVTDVFGYGAVLDGMRADGKLDADGFVSRDDWFAATADHEYPDAPPRLWDAFHALVVDPPDVMFTTRNGFTAGETSFEKFITMRSTHGSFDQINSATFVMSMHGCSQLKTMRTRDVMRAIEPTYTPTARSRR